MDAGLTVNLNTIDNILPIESSEPSACVEARNLFQETMNQALIDGDNGQLELNIKQNIQEKMIESSSLRESVSTNIAIMGAALNDADIADTDSVSTSDDREHDVSLEETVDLMDDSIALAWFSVSSFEPPTTIKSSESPLLESEAPLEGINLSYDKSDKKSKSTNADIVTQEDLASDSASKVKARDINLVDFINQGASSSQLNHLFSQPPSNSLENEEVESLAPIAGQEWSAALPFMEVKQTSPSPVATQSPLSTTIAVPIDEAQWQDNFNQQIVWMGQHKINSAVIKLNPEALGPVEINIKLLNDDASINILAHHAPVRDLIEQALPRLRDMMQEQGISLTDVNIESNRQGQSQPQREDRHTGENTRSLSIAEPVKTSENVTVKRSGLVDYFA